MPTLRPWANEDEELIDFPAVAGELVNVLTMLEHTLGDIISIIQRRIACAVVERMRESRESFSQWISTYMARRGSAVHRWTKRDSALGKPPWA